MIKNGKLFGKINIIDLLVILVVLVAVAAVALFLLKPKDGGDTLIMKFRIEEVDEFVAEKVHIGDDLYDDTFSLDLGKVTEIEIDDSITYGGITNGVYTVGSKEGYKSMIITGECKGTKTSLGAEIGGKKYGVGHSFVLRAGDAKLYLRVYDIMLKDDYDKQNEENAQKAEPLSEIKLTLFLEEIEDYVADSITIGAPVKNTDRNGELGIVSNVRIEDSISYHETEDGFKISSKEGYSSIYIECTAMGKITDEGVEIDGKTYNIGDGFNVRLGTTKAYLKLRSVN